MSHVMQISPTSIFEMKVNGVVFAQIVSLGSTVISTTPSFNWIAWDEHWFVPNGINLYQLLNNSTSIEVVATFPPSSSPPSQAYIDAAGSFVANGTFQFYAHGYLGSGDWIAGTPPKAVSPVARFNYNASGTSPVRPRFLIDVDTNNPTRIRRINWYTQQTFSAYTQGFNVARVPSPAYPSPCYYYASPPYPVSEASSEELTGALQTVVESVRSQLGAAVSKKGDRPTLFPHGIHKIHVRVAVGASSVEVTVEGPDRGSK